MMNMLALCVGLPLAASPGAADSLPDTPFVQEYHEAHLVAGQGEANDVAAVAVDDAETVWADTKAGVYCLKKGAQDWTRADAGPDFDGVGKRERAAAFTPAPGIPFAEVQCVAKAPDGRVWVGTPSGVARYDGEGWSLRHSRRWLVNDNVRDVVFDAAGTAWIATAGGVSAIKQRTMTLEDKAAFFHEACMARHVRAPGLVESCRLTAPGDLSSWEPDDDDNDGEYTSMYLVMECCRYAATKDPQALENAKKAFDALHFLQTVTETPGFVARSVVPATWTRMHDPNRTYTEAELAELKDKDPRYKPVEKRWHPSADGKWLWKGDTSSDEISGHFFGYLFYYRLAADEPERERVRQHVRRIMDYIMDNGYVLIDVDGTHTRWAVWAPERLNDDPLWAPERYVNSLEILSFLEVTHFMTGDEKYRRACLDLLHKHHYLKNITKRRSNSPWFRNYIDDELLSLVFPGLLLCEKDPELLGVYRDCLDHWYEAMGKDGSPLFNFIYAILTGAEANLDDSVAFLRDAPLDLINWRIDNSQRKDLELKHAPELEPFQTHPLPPPSERAVVRWDKNPWRAIQGDGGNSEWCPVYWLLPYWMGRCYGFIQPEQ